MKYRIYGQFTGNIGDKSESIPWPFISIRATCVSSAWRITRTINTKPWWKWCCATRIPSRGSDCSAITSRGSRQRRPWRPAWPVKAWRSLSTRGWSKHPASVPAISMRIFTMASNLPPEISGSVMIFIRSRTFARFCSNGIWRVSRAESCNFITLYYNQYRKRRNCTRSFSFFHYLFAAL